MIPAVKRTGTVILALLLGIILSGGHLALLQTVAWASMIASRAASDSFAFAVETTFDGQHPCPICLAISQHKAHDDDKRAPEQPTKKMKIDCLALAPHVDALVPVMVETLAASPGPFIVRATEAPPTPPPTRS